MSTTKFVINASSEKYVPFNSATTEPGTPVIFCRDGMKACPTEYLFVGLNPRKPEQSVLMGNQGPFMAYNCDLMAAAKLAKPYTAKIRFYTDYEGTMRIATINKDRAVNVDVFREVASWVTGDIDVTIYPPNTVK